MRPVVATTVVSLLTTTTWSQLSTFPYSTLIAVPSPAVSVPFVSEIRRDDIKPLNKGKDSGENIKMNDLCTRGNPGIFICARPHWQGSCFWRPIDPADYTNCATITAHDGWASMGPDAGLKVDLYRNTNCSRESIFWKDLENPGDDNMPARVAAAGLAVPSATSIGAVFHAA